MANFTFKKNTPTGRYSSFELSHTDIKLNKKECGIISETRNNGYKVRFAVKNEITKNDPAGFKWVSFKRSFANEEEARAFVKEKNNWIQENLDLHLFED